MYKLFNLKEEDDNVSVLYVTLPEGRTMAELTRECSEQIRNIIMEKRVFGRDIRVYGRSPPAWRWCSDTSCATWPARCRCSTRRRMSI